MAKLTDLPEEVLALVLRNFLSSTLTSHSHLCEWNTGYPDIANRANLSSVALVSKAWYVRAMPLLFEQLLEARDIYMISKNGESMRVALRYARYAVYVNVAIWPPDLGERNTAVLKILSRCEQVKHLRLQVQAYVTFDVGSCLSPIVEILSKTELQSLSISDSPRSCTPLLLRQLPLLQSLVGLRLALDAASHPDPRELEPSMQQLRLKAIHIAGACDDSVFAILTLPCPRTLEQATIRLRQPSQRVQAPIFGAEQWPNLEVLKIVIGRSANLEGLLAISNLTGLRRLSFEPDDDADFDIAYAGILSKMPATVTRLELSDLSAAELRQILELAQQSGRLPAGLKSLNLRLGYLKSSGLSFQALRMEKEEFLLLAQSAVEALQSIGVEVEPANLVQILAEIRTL